jgi:hypothetical protein
MIAMDADSSQLAGWLQSSQDAGTVANKVKGVILTFSSLIVLVVAQYVHIQLNANDMITLSTEAGTVGGAIWMIYGSVLHLVTWWGTKKISNPLPPPLPPPAQ